MFYTHEALWNIETFKHLKQPYRGMNYGRKIQS